MKLEVGMYARTTDGIICKLYTEFHEESVDVGIGIFNEVDGFFIDKEKIHYVEKREIVKASNNKIDLIEVGDYVNGYLVTAVSKDAYGETIVFVGQRLIEEAGYYRSYYSKDIKTIVTKEQFESIEYKGVYEI